MADPTPSKTVTRAKTGSKTTSVLGWVAVAMSTLVACFGIMFLTGDAITEPPTLANWTAGLVPFFRQ